MDMRLLMVNGWCFLSIQWLLFAIIQLKMYGNNAAQLTFKSTDIPDEYCVDEFSWDATRIHVPLYCDDIDNILVHYCGNVTFFRIIDASYCEALDSTQHLCTFFLQNGQNMQQTYILSDNIPINQIKFSSISNNETNIVLSNSFLTITTYEGSVDISNMDFASDGSIFSFIDVVADDIQLYITIENCQFIDMNATNGSIVNIPKNTRNNEYVKGIQLTFENCKVENVFAEFGAILYIERNNVTVTFSHFAMTNIMSFDAVHWLCQKRNDGADLCGNLFITNSDIYGIDSNIFTIDLSLDPAQTYFILDVDTSIFTNINGIIFNFNRADDKLAPSAMRIQQQNAFVNVQNSHFEDNGIVVGRVSLWYLYSSNYIYLMEYPHNGTIFTINSITVPNISIGNSNFTHNAGCYGAIFYWYCSRKLQLITDTYCGSISLQNNIFFNNMIGRNRYNVAIRYGSLLYAQIHENMNFYLLIEDCEFIKQSGNSIHFEKSTAELPMVADMYSNISNISTSNFSANSWFLESMIVIERSIFKNCRDGQDTKGSSNFAAILTLTGLNMVYTFITDSVFDGNQRKYEGSAVFSTDYAPLLLVNGSNFTNNNAVLHGLFNIVQNDAAMIEISHSMFESNAAYSSIVSSADDGYVSLHITASAFIKNVNKETGCFNLYAADINIIDSSFDSNECRYFCAVILNLRDGGQLRVDNTLFTKNNEISQAFPVQGLPTGLFNINTANVTVTNSAFTRNGLWNGAIYVTKGSIELSNNTYIDNKVPNIVAGNANSVKIKECMFISNIISSKMIQARDIMVAYSHFAKNTGGSLFSYDADGFVLNLMQSKFTNNEVIDTDSDGSVAAVTGSNSQIDAKNCVFRGNAATSFGGVIFINNTAATWPSLVSITDCNIKENKAGFGAFLFGVGITLNITDTVAYNNIATSYVGGFLYLERSLVNMKSVELVENDHEQPGKHPFISLGVFDEAAYQAINYNLGRCDFGLRLGNAANNVYLWNTELRYNECCKGCGRVKVLECFSDSCCKKSLCLWSDSDVIRQDVDDSNDCECYY